MYRKHPSLPKEHQFVSMESVESFSDWEDNRHRLGHHLIIDLMGCNPDKLTHCAEVEEILREAAAAAKATVVASKMHQFQPIGVSGALVLSESHITIHTWPEVDGYAAVDIFTCGPKTDNFAANKVLKDRFEAREVVLVEVERGKQQSTQPSISERWFHEDLDPLKGFVAGVKVKALLDEVQSPVQLIRVHDTCSVGKMLTIDGIITYTEYDHYAYHEMMVHVPMQSHPDPRKVLIIGGGDGGSLAEVAKYANVSEIVVCDIDEHVKKTAIKHFPASAAAYKDPRVRCVHQDGAHFVANFQNHFDVIIVDCTDFYGPAEILARKVFHDAVHHALTPEGIMVMQGRSMFYDRDWCTSMHKQCSEVFPIVEYYKAHVPTFPSGSIGFFFLSKEYKHMDVVSGERGGLPTPPGSDEQSAGKSRGLAQLQPNQELQYYTPEMHSAAFQLPAFAKKMFQIA